MIKKEEVLKIIDNRLQDSYNLLEDLKIQGYDIDEIGIIETEEAIIDCLELIYNKINKLD